MASDQVDRADQVDPVAPAPDGADGADGVAGPAELARLRAERDALRAELDGLQRRTRRRRGSRQAVAATCVVLACAVLVAAVVGLWARRNFLDTDRFVSRVGPLIEEPAVQDALATRLTEEAMVLVDPEALFEDVLPERGRLLAVPLAGAVEEFVRDQVEAVLASDGFASLWATVLAAAHEQAVDVLRGDSEVVSADGERVTLNVLPVLDAVLARVTSLSPEVFGREVDIPDVTVEQVPDAAVRRLEEAFGVDLGDDFGRFTVYDDGRLAAAQDAVRLLDRLAPALLVVGVALAALAVWLAPGRRRALLQLAAGLAVGMVLVRRLAFRVQDEVAALPPRPAGRRSAGLVAEAFLQPLTTFAAWVLVGAAVVAAVAVLTASYPWVVALRRRAVALGSGVVAAAGGRARDEATVRWVTTHRDPLLAGVAALAVAVLWVADLSWAGLLVALALFAGLALAVHHVGTPPAPT